jgi:hypothetical protein
MEMEVYGPEHEGWGIRGWLHHIFRKEELQARPESRPDSREQAAVRMQRLWRGRRARRQLIEVRRQRKRQSALKTALKGWWTERARQQSFSCKGHIPMPAFLEDVHSAEEDGCN